MKESVKSNGKADHLPTETTAVDSLSGLDWLRPYVDLSLQASNRAASLFVDLQKLQAQAWVTAGRSMQQALDETVKAGDLPSLLKAQARFVTSTMEQAGALGQRSLELALGSVQQGTPPSAARAASPEGPNPAESWLADPQAAWTQLAQQWINVMNRGVMPS